MRVKNWSLQEYVCLTDLHKWPIKQQEVTHSICDIIILLNNEANVE